MNVLGFEFQLATVVIGVVTGLVYGVLACGLVLVYRATRIINFAYAEMGAVAAVLLAKLVLDLHVNYFVALLLAMAAGGATGALLEVTVVRRLSGSSRLVLLVGTIGAAQLLLAAQGLIPKVEAVGRFPTPLPWSVDLGSFRLLSEHLMALVIVPAVVVALTWFMNRTAYGIAIRASADNAAAAELAGISRARVSTLVWTLAGVMAAITVALVIPLRGGVLGLGAEQTGPALLLRAFAAALFGGLISFRMALLGGIVVGVMEALLFVATGTAGPADAMLFAVVLLMVMLRKSEDGEDGAWSLTRPVRPLPSRLAHVWWLRRLPALGWAAGLSLALLLPVLFTGSNQMFLLTRAVLYAVIGLSVVVLTGWAGQLSLGQFAIAGVGSMVAAALSSRGMELLPAAGYATVAGVITAMVVGFPALRVRGLFLAVTTLAFAVAARSWLFGLEVFLGGQSTATVPRGVVLGVDLESNRALYYVALGLLTVAVALASRLRRGAPGRLTLAVRDNPDAAASFAVSPTAAKLSAFAFAGGLAASAGALLGALRVTFGPGDFPASESLTMVGMAVIGGIGSVAGGVLGAVYVVGVPALLGGSATAVLLSSGVGLLLLLLYLPGGLSGLLQRLMETLVTVADRRAPAPSPRPAVDVVLRRPDTAPSAAAAPLLEVRNVGVRFGGLTALEDVSLTLQAGEILGLIGSNGAGKSTLLNVISGFRRPSAGRVLLFGQDVTDLPAKDRAALGVSRMFQNARLFPDLTVQETIMVALERDTPGEYVPSMLGLPPARRAERAKVARADDLMAYLGLGGYANSFISELSTGTRRIVEIACLLARESRVLLLDEPAAGVAQRETEALGPLIEAIQRDLGAGVLLIEHDMPLVMSISDRICCMSAGRRIAEGSPEEIRRDPRVIAAYLGTDERAIRRSGAVAPAVPAGPDAEPVWARLTRSQLLEHAQAAGVAVDRRAPKAELLEVVSRLDATDQ